MGDETITEAEIWADIDAAFPSLPERMPGDIDIKQIMDRYELSETGAHKRMLTLARTGKWEIVTVSADAGKQVRRKVIRRISNV